MAVFACLPRHADGFSYGAWMGPGSGASTSGSAAVVGGFSMVSTRTRVVVSSTAGVVGGLVVGLVAGWRYGLLGGWMLGAAVLIGWILITVLPMDSVTTASHARRENPAHDVLDVVVLGAAVASLGAVAMLLMGGNDNERALDAALSVCSVALASGAVHTVFLTRYAGLYYPSAGVGGGIDFNQDDPPEYSDFAYLAFTLGMTFQVSDTDLKTKLIRATALRHALLSYLFGAIIVATTINLVAGLAK